MSNIKCILIDDELPSLTYLKALVEQIDEVEVVKVYNQSEKFLNEYKNLDFDLIVSDIQMPVLDGLALANLISDKPFIFTTAYREFAVDAFELNAIDYLTKPIKKERLEKAFEKAKKSLVKPNDTVLFTTVNSDRGKMILNYNDLMYIQVSELDSRDKIAHLKNGSQFTIKNITFKELNSVLPKSLFCQINKKEIISYQIIQFFTAETITSNVCINGKFLEFNLSSSFTSNFKLK